jgi:hypothetical protein
LPGHFFQKGEYAFMAYSWVVGSPHQVQKQKLGDPSVRNSWWWVGIVDEFWKRGVPSKSLQGMVHLGIAK